MANQYRKEGEAPSGRRYVWRGLNPFELLEVYEGVPEIETTDGEIRQTPSAIAAAKRMWMKTICYGTVIPRVVEAEDISDPEAVPFDELGSDMTWLRERIMEESGLYGPKADEARRFPEERGELRPASRNGKRDGLSSVGDYADPETTTRTPSSLRSFGVGEGENLARPAVRKRARRASGQRH